MIFRNKKVSPNQVEESDDDIDCDALENKMMRSLEKERNTIKNWHKILMRVQMINAFKLSMRLPDLPNEIEENEPQIKEEAWWESGFLILYPENRVGLLWGVFKTVAIFISLFSLSYCAGFLFQ